MSRSPKSSGRVREIEIYRQVAEKQEVISPDLCNVETREILFKYVPLYEEIEEIATSHVLKDLWLFPE